MNDMNRSIFSHPKAAIADDIGQALWEAGARLAFEAADAAKRATARKRKPGATLRPGEATPLWNALAAELRREFAAHGEQARVARVMGVSRQALNAWITGVRLPDAERTLQLIAWMLARRRGQEVL